MLMGQGVDSGIVCPHNGISSHHRTTMTAAILTGDQITDYRAKMLLSALKLECLGMKRRGPSVYSVVKAEYNLKGSKQSVYNQLAAILHN